MKLDNISLIELQPSILKNDPVIQGICEAMEPYFRKLAKDVRLTYIYGRIDELEENVIDELAWQFHVDFYDYKLSLEKKRTLVKNSIRWHRIKGTPQAVIEVATSVFGRTKLKEWFEYGGEPYFFSLDIDITEQGASKENLNKLDTLIDAYKNKRSWVDVINLFLTNKGTIYFGSVMTVGEEITVYPWQSTDVESKGKIYVANGQHTGLENITLYPRRG